MISENDKQAILNGAYGVNRNGKKCKFIGITDEPVYSHFFVYYDSSNQITTCCKLTKNFLYSIGDIRGLDVVGLWEDKPESFDLERALSGEPVLTRDGSKAYVQISISQPKELEHYSLIGFGYNGEQKEFLHWDETGKVMADDYTCDDIVGMWRDESVQNKVTINLPYRLTKPQDEMWILTTDGCIQSNYDKNIPLHILESRPYFGSENDAKAWLDAMMNNHQ